MTFSLLLERTEQVLEKIYQGADDPSPTLLFDSTELAECREQSPLWLDTAHNPRLLECVSQEPGLWPGLIIDSAASTQTLLSHLRHILLVRFGEDRKGVLRYSNPTTASYLFTLDDAQSRATWLGPISHVRWYGGTWADQARGEQRWFSVDNPDAEHWKAIRGQVPARLGPREEQALQRQRKEHFVYQWWKNQGDMAFAQACQYLDQGLDNGFVQAGELHTFLALRSGYPHHELPPLTPSVSNEERLELLQRYLHDKESLT
ncbi:DUF4123 domain-containing protein [Pseudomonas sp. Au-Pse12]|uniref:DUF4123 domain-containing protein n=1 Tax=Pseudomonas sp. Au-Pse12 TaxID=2906459 RepID=UPI001E4A37E6|nr:DUF4123 domain-containing protein [Pseudomonas sp. Au-Pse12]MCE4055148.1 DUF4123 domain-containing protein [Pseudomonas sp. Au-Pse12]